MFLMRQNKDFKMPQPSLRAIFAPIKCKRQPYCTGYVRRVRRPGSATTGPVLVN